MAELVALTWNMQGRSADLSEWGFNVVDNWNYVLPRLAQDTDAQLIALQEAGPNLPGGVLDDPTKAIHGLRGVDSPSVQSWSTDERYRFHYYVTNYSWEAQYRFQALRYRVFWLNVGQTRGVSATDGANFQDPGRMMERRVNLAVLVRDDVPLASTPIIVESAPSTLVQDATALRPTLGVELGPQRGTPGNLLFFSVHVAAGGNGFNARPLVDQVNQYALKQQPQPRGLPWAALGDYNREPVDAAGAPWLAPTVGVIARPDGYTHNARRIDRESTYDYMTRNPGAVTTAGEVMAEFFYRYFPVSANAVPAGFEMQVPVTSDHYPVRYVIEY